VSLASHRRADTAEGMGGKCTPCFEKPIPAGSQIGNEPQVARKRDDKDKEILHEGQHRANLQIKGGGFGLKNFAASNAGKIEEFFIWMKKIGEGGFGTVKSAKDKRTGALRAVKSVSKDSSEAEHLREEMDIMRLLDHPNIVRFYECFEDKRYVYMILELCEGGELLERIMEAGTFSEALAAKSVRQMFLAINYLHQNYIMHRDLKPENWLLSSRAGGVGKTPLKLIDFGISRRFKPGVPVRTKAGTPNYLAPEVLSGKYDEKADVWSTGVVAYILLSGTHPFNGRTPDDVLKQVKASNYSTEGGPWRAVSGDAKTFVRSCMSKYPTNRISATEALEDNWIKDCEDLDDADAIGTLELSGLKTFSRMNHLKKAAVTVVATQLTSEKIEKLRVMFMQMDNNSDGTLSISELKAGLEWSGVACPADLDALLKEADTDGSGVVDYTEFLAATMDKKLYHQEDVVWTAFKKFDLNGSGSIDRQELAKVLCDESVAEALHLGGNGDESGGGSNSQLLAETFAAVDSNGDGLIDFDEFLQMMRQHEGGKPSYAKQQSQGGAEAAAGSSPRQRKAPPLAPKEASPRSKQSRRKAETRSSPRARTRNNTAGVDAAEEAGGGGERKGRRGSKPAASTPATSAQT